VLETIKTAYYTYRTVVWLQAKVREHGFAQKSRLNSGPVCDDKGRNSQRHIAHKPHTAAAAALFMSQTERTYSL